MPYAILYYCTYYHLWMLHYIMVLYITITSDDHDFDNCYVSKNIINDYEI